jgi:hypothetical protein
MFTAVASPGVIRAMPFTFGQDDRAAALVESTEVVYDGGFAALRREQAVRDELSIVVEYAFDHAQQITAPLSPPQQRLDNGRICDSLTELPRETPECPRGSVFKISLARDALAYRARSAERAK